MSPSKVDSRPTYKIASIPADGIGPEVISAGITVLKKLASTLDTFDLTFEHFDWSSDYYKKHGKYLPDDGLETLKKFDAILFGAVGAPGMKIRRINAAAKKHQLRWLMLSRCAGSHLTLGPAPGDLPASSTVCKCQAYEGNQGHAIPAAKLHHRRPGLGHHPGKL